ncbi:MAG: acyloxyacyl hydrolase [Pseudomonadota bacterium]
MVAANHFLNNKNSEALVAIGYTHYSNADTKRPNDGLDFFWLSWGLPFQSL